MTEHDRPAFPRASPSPHERTENRWLAFFATCAAGTELALKDELRELGCRRVRADRGGVRFEGPIDDAIRVCLGSRIAVRVLQPIARFAAGDDRALYDGVRTIAWERWLSRHHTLAVSAVCRQSRLMHTSFVAQRTKDAIVDRLRDREGARPDVDRRDPDVAIFVRLARDEATIHLDLSGDSLHRRGWRTEIGGAPLKETLAAAILRLSGWDREGPLVDPTCGSGTIPIEADLWARNVAPNLARLRFGFERWASHDETERALVRAMRERLRAEERPEGPTVLGSDIDARAIAIAMANARRARSRARFRRAELRDLAPTDPPGHVVANLPYGFRLESTGIDREIAEILPRLRGHRVSLLLGEPLPETARRLGPPHSEHELWNGPIAVRLVSWDLTR